MVTTFVILGLLAFVSAIGAAYRVQDKRRAIAPAPPLPTRSTQSVQEAELPAARRPMPQPDRDADQAVPAISDLSPVAIPVAPEADGILATSLSVSELVQSEAEGVAHQVSQADEGAFHPSATAPQEHHTLLEEIAQLGRAGQIEQIEQLAHHVHNPDSVVRVAVAFALGEIAERHQGNSLDAIVPLLNELSQDTDSQVRLQALAAIGRIQLPDVSA